MLAPVTTTLADIQKKLVEILTPRSILIGHSLNSDLTALKVTHPYIIDTALIFPHPRGPPLKSALKYLAQKYLSREIQKGHGNTGPGAGHDSIEDARTCLDLVKQKCEKGKEWGLGDSQGENIFKRVARAGIKYKGQGGSSIPGPIDGRSSAFVDWGDPKKGPGAAANHIIGCHSDEEVKLGILRALKGDHDGKEIVGGGVDFIWARFRELEALKGWWNNNKNHNSEIALQTALPTEVVGEAKTRDRTRIEELAENLPKQQEESSAVAGIETGREPNDNPNTVPSKQERGVLGNDMGAPLESALAILTKHISQVYAALPPCTAFVVYSGSGDPREMSRLQQVQTRFKKEYKTRKWDDLTVKWTDTEEQALKKATSIARNGIGFLTVK